MKNKKNGNITLSQTVLIVGIVSLILFAIILVPFYKSYKQKVAIVKYQKTYALLQQANRMYSLVSGESMNKYNTNLPINEFAETYFTPYLQISEYCKGKQDNCWNTPQYKDLKNTKKFDMSLYSIVLDSNGTVGFHKNQQGLITMILDTDGKVGENKLGKDIFVFSFYDSENHPKLCDEKIYKEKTITNGIHFGGYDKCGIPQDTYEYNELISKNFFDGCNKKSPTNEQGLGLGTGCGALLKINNWSMDKNYPW